MRKAGSGDASALPRCKINLRARDCYCYCCGGGSGGGDGGDGGGRPRVAACALLSREPCALFSADGGKGLPSSRWIQPDPPCGAALARRGRFTVLFEKPELGSLHSVLRSEPGIPDELRLHTATGIALGVEYLHNRACVHGSLSSLTVFLEPGFTARLLITRLSEEREPAGPDTHNDTVVDIADLTPRTHDA